MMDATVWLRLSADGLLARSVMSSCQRSIAACFVLAATGKLLLLAAILTYHHPSERRNQGCACRATMNPPNPEVPKGNPEVDWKGPLQLLVRLVPGREAILSQASLSRKVQRKVQISFSSPHFASISWSQPISLFAVATSGRHWTRTSDFHRVRMQAPQPNHLHSKHLPRRLSPLVPVLVPAKPKTQTLMLSTRATRWPSSPPRWLVCPKPSGSNWPPC